jgi:glucosamine-phosphate N-acetyltransferase
MYFQPTIPSLERFNYMMARPDTYYVRVITSPSGQIVATGTLLVERKFIRGCGLAGHIEDIVVDGEQRGRNLGKILLDRLKSLAQEIGCYKVILDCERDRVGFYEKCGFTEKGSQMTVYFST